MRYIELTNKQKDVLEALEKYGKLKKAAEVLGISYNVAKQRLYRVRVNCRETKLFLRECKKIGYDAIFARIPLCKNCQSMDARSRRCKREGIRVVTDVDTRPCAFWRPEKELIEKQRRLERQIKEIKTVEQIHIVQNLIKQSLLSGTLTEPQYESLCEELSERASKVGERKSELKLGLLGSIGWEKKGAIT